METTINIDELLLKAASEGASDVHLSVGRHPTFRIDGALFSLNSFPILNDQLLGGVVDAITPKRKKKDLDENLDLDISYGIKDKVRFRVNIFHQMEHLSIAFRIINSRIPAIEELGLPRQTTKMITSKQGFVLFVGPTGSGKSTSMAALIEMINQNRDDHIVTIEDPIEYIFTQSRSIIDQREIGQDVISFARGLREALRQDIDVLLVGEMRDPETISAALTAAETGHLVFATLHTNTAAQTIDRIVDVFPSNLQNQVRSQLDNTLIGIVSQRLIPRIGGGRVPAVEILFNNTAVANLIRDNAIHQIPQVIETSLNEGMMSLNRSLANLVKQQLINTEQAMIYSIDPKNLKTLLR
jgi:twitching motility protein PilT